MIKRADNSALFYVHIYCTLTYAAVNKAPSVAKTMASKLNPRVAIGVLLIAKNQP